MKTVSREEESQEFILGSFFSPKIRKEREHKDVLGRKDMTNNDKVMEYVYDLENLMDIFRSN